MEGIRRVIYMWGAKWMRPIKIAILLVLILPATAFSGPFDPMTNEQREAKRVERLQKNYQDISSGFDESEWVEISLTLWNFYPPSDKDIDIDSPQAQQELANFLNILPAGSYTLEDTYTNVGLLGVRLKIKRPALDHIYSYPHLREYRKRLNVSKPVPQPIYRDEKGNHTAEKPSKEKPYTKEQKEKDILGLHQKVNQSPTGLLRVSVYMKVPERFDTVKKGSAEMSKIVRQTQKLISNAGFTPDLKPFHEPITPGNIKGRIVYLFAEVDQSALDYLSQHEWVVRIKEFKRK